MAVDLDDVHLQINTCSVVKLKTQPLNICPGTELKISYIRFHASGIESVVKAAIRATFIPCESWASGFEDVELEHDSHQGCHWLRIPELAKGTRYRIRFDIEIPDPADPGADPQIETEVLQDVLVEA